MPFPLHVKYMQTLCSPPNSAANRIQHNNGPLPVTPQCCFLWRLSVLIEKHSDQICHLVENRCALGWTCYHHSHPVQIPTSWPEPWGQVTSSWEFDLPSFYKRSWLSMWTTCHLPSQLTPLWLSAHHLGLEATRSPHVEEPDHSCLTLLLWKACTALSSATRDLSTAHAVTKSTKVNTLVRV